MDKNLLQKAKAPMIALIQTKNILKTDNLKTKMKRAFAIFFSLFLSLFAIATTAQAQAFGSPSRAIDECKKPTYVTISEIGTSNATLSWTENGEATEWRIMLNDDDDNLIQAPTNPFTLTNLTPETEYTVKVTPWCEMEKWSDPFSFTTLAADACQKPYGVTVGNITSSSATVSWTGFNDSYQLRYRAVTQVVFEDGFENDLDNWTVYTQGEAPYGTGWLIQNSLVHSGNYAAVAISYDNIAYNANNWLVSPQLDLQGTMRFWVLASDSYPDQYEVLLSTTGNAIDDFTITLQPMGKASGEWTEVSIDLDNYAGQQGYIAIHHVDYDAYYLIIDDFEIRASTPWTIRNAEETSVEITSLDAGTTYESQIQGVCEISSSDWTDMASFTTESQLFSGGSGTETDPYIIATTDDMDALAALVNGGNDQSGVFFLQTDTLDYRNKTYTPIGNETNFFQGNYNGNGNIITGVNINTEYAGLFGRVGTNGVVSNLTLDGGVAWCDIRGVYAGGIAAVNQGEIVGCSVLSSFSGIETENGFSLFYNSFVDIKGGIVGGLVGENKKTGKVYDAECTAKINGNSVSGGLVGINNGQVNGIFGGVLYDRNPGNYVGGLVGQQDLGTLSGINKGYFDGHLNGSRFDAQWLGGIVGYQRAGTVENCLYVGNKWNKFAFRSGAIIACDESGTYSNNYYVGECEINGVYSHTYGSVDVTGQAMRGYKIEPQDPLVINLEGNIGLTYEGNVYAGNEQGVVVSLNTPLTPQCYILSAGTLVDNGNDTFTITMPAENITVSGNIVEIDGLYYELSCEGGTTATVIYDISYDTLDYVGIEDFEYGDIQYTVTAIADGAFDGLDNLMGIYCHSNISTIGDYAFRNCTGIDYFGFYRTHTPPTLGEGVFEGLRIDTLSITVPFCSQYDYDQHAVFGQFGEIFGNEACEYNFYNEADDNQWSNPANWRNADYETCTEAPGADARVAIFADCEIGADVTVGSITIDGFYDEYFGLYNCLTVKDGATLTATNFIYNSGDARNFIIEDGAQVYHPNAGAQATVEKNITAYTPNSKNGWHLVSSPAIESFAPTADNGFLANEYDLYFYEEPTHHWRNHKPNGQYANFNIEPLKGYLYANNQDVTLVFAGNLCAGNAMVNVPLYYTPTAGILKGFNLVGNPFAHNVTAFTGSNVATEVYRMNGDGNDLMVGTIGTANPLLPGEGFFVKATGDDASITFNSRATNAERSNITLEVSENGLIVDRFILKRDGAPLEKFTLNENSTRVYATEGAQDWAVAVIASEAKQSSRTEQPVSFKAAKNGTYTLTVNVENMDLDYLHLIDNLTGADVNLLTPPAFGHPLPEGEAQSGAELGSNSPATDSRTPAGIPPLRGSQGESKNPAGVPPLQRGQGGFNYTFTAKTTDYASRFRLVFSNDDAGEDACEPPFAYISNGNIIITTDMGDATLQIVDVMGRVIASYGGHTRYVTTNGMPAGVYVLRLINGDKVRVQKIVIE